MIGAIIGDIVGSIYEFDNIKTKDFELFNYNCMFTDDTVMTVAVAKTLSLHNRNNGIADFKKNLMNTMHKYGEIYPDLGYGGHFLKWLETKSTEPYNSCGNGSAMRVSAIGLWAESLEETEAYAKASAEITHNHPDGIKGAQAIAGAVFLAKNGFNKEKIKEYFLKYYTLDFTLAEIRPTYEYEIVCKKSVPQAMQAFLESEDFEDAIRNAISIGGDSDTIAAITGSIAEAFYGVNEEIKETALSYLDDYLLDEIDIIESKKSC